MGGIRLESATKIYSNGVKAVDDLSLDIHDGEFMVLVGPSGCGKSTIMRMIAGLEGVTKGSIHIGDRDVTRLTPRARDIAMVFQNYALYPHMNVRQNLGFGLKLRKTPKAEIARRVDETARILDLPTVMERKPAALSGGQRQRVAIGRAMVREPTAFLMDEPLSNLDAKLRVSMRAELTRLHEKLGATIVYVTHDQIEAMTLGQRVAVLRDGVLQQCDTPQRLFDHPVNIFVASFIGSPSMNLVEAELAEGVASFADQTVRLLPSSPLANFRGRLILGIRPTDLDLANADRPEAPRLRVRVDIVEELGSECLVIFRIDAPKLETDATRAAAEASSEDAQLLAEDERTTFTARVTGRRQVRPGDTIELAANQSHMHFFDLDTGLAVEGGAPDMEEDLATRAH